MSEKKKKLGKLRLPLPKQKSKFHESNLPRIENNTFELDIEEGVEEYERSRAEKTSEKSKKGHGR